MRRQSFQPALIALSPALAIPFCLSQSRHWEALTLAYFFVALPFTLLLMTLFAVWRKNFPLLAAAALIVPISIFLLHRMEALRERGRWLLQAQKYKIALLAEPYNSPGFHHMEWDGWGGFGAGDTTLYLVFDSQNRLAGLANTRKPGTVEGLPCEVAGVRRLESQWFAVLFYTDTDWNHCN